MSIEIENRESRVENQELELTGRVFDSAELQGHAIKNQDLLAAAGAVSLSGSAGMSALDEDVEAATAVRGHTSLLRFRAPSGRSSAFLAERACLCFCILRLVQRSVADVCLLSGVCVCVWRLMFEWKWNWNGNCSRAWARCCARSIRSIRACRRATGS